MSTSIIILRHKEVQNTFNLPDGEEIRLALIAYFDGVHTIVMAKIKISKSAAGLVTKDATGDVLDLIWDEAAQAFGGGSDLASAMEPVLDLIWDESAQSFGASVGLDPADFTSANPEVKAAIEQQATDLASSVTATTIDELKAATEKVKALEAAGTITPDEAIPELEKEYAVIFDEMPDWKAGMIAVTEASRAYHEMQLLMGRDSGIVTGWRWRANADACFGAGSKVLKVVGGVVTKANIDAIVPGDMVIGGSGQPRKVLAVSSKLYRGTMVRGDGFTATPNHRFLTAGGWKPIGQYAGKTFLRRALDLVVREAEHTPAALAKVCGLSPILGGNLGLAVPVHAVAEDDRFRVIDDEINHPSVIHRYLFAKRDPGRCEQPGHSNFNVGPLFLDAVIVNVATDPGAEIVPPAARLADTARVFGERLAARLAGAFGARLPHAVRVAKHELAVCLARANGRAESLVGTILGEPPGTEGLPASLTSLVGKERHGRIGLTREPLARATAVFRSAFRMAGRGVEWLTARCAFQGYRRGPVLVPAGVAAESRRGDLVRHDAIGVAALLALESDHVPIIRHRLSITNTIRLPVYDIQVETDRSFVLACGLVAHNCPICIEIEQDCPVVKEGEAFAILGDDPLYSMITCPPAHPNCCLPETPIVAPIGIAGIVAQYDGPVVRVRFSDGTDLTVTPNHMLLTIEGFAAASSLMEGDEVIRYCGHERVSGSGPHDDWKPTPIEDVVGSFAESPRMGASRVPVAPEYLHGDAARCHGHIDVVTPDSLLFDSLDPCGIERLLDGSLRWANVGGFPLNPERDPTAVLLALRDATDGGMGSLRESKARLRSRALIACGLGIGVRPGSQTRRQKSAADCRAADAESLRQCKLRFPREITTAKVVYVDRSSIHYSGPVYDVQTLTSLYLLGNGIASSNCLCSLEPVLIDDIQPDTWGVTLIQPAGKKSMPLPRSWRRPLLKAAAPPRPAMRVKFRRQLDGAAGELA